LLTATDDRILCENRLTVLRAANGELRSVVGVLQVDSDRTKDGGRATELHDATRRMMSAETAEEIGEIAVEAARSTLGPRICTLWLYDAAEEALRPIAIDRAATALLDTFPTYTAGNSVSWEAFVEGEARVYEDLSAEPDRYDPDTPIRSEMILPLGAFGISNAGSTRAGAFDAADEHVAKLLAANAEAALGRADREERLRSREAELRRQNARFEEFASVLSHDLRNPLNVITGTLELVRETGDLKQLEPIERAADRIERLTTVLLTLARQGRTVGDPESVRLGPIAEDAWAGTIPDRESARLHLDEDLSDESTAGGTVEGDPIGLQQLFESLFANAVEYGSPDVVEVGPLPDAAGFYVADDGPGIAPARRERVFDHDYTTSERGGARFEIRTG
jgi:signal transduction histidine kinase